MTTAATTVPSAETEAFQPDEAAIVGDLFPDLAGNDGGEPAKTVPQPGTETEEEEGEDNDAAEAKPETGEPEAPKDPFSLLRLNELFDEKALSTKQGLVKARETIMSAHKAAREYVQQANDRHIVAKRHEAKAKANLVESNRAVKAAQAIEARVVADLDTAMNSGNAEEVWSALSRITKRDATKLYEQMTEVQIGKKKADNTPKDPRVDTVLEKLTKLEKAKEEEREQQRRREQMAERVAWLETLDKDVNAGAETTYPTIAYVLTLDGKAREMADHVYDLACGHQAETGEWPSNKMVLDYVEASLKPIVRVPKKAPVAAPKNGTSRALPGRGVSPTLGAQRSSGKSLNEMTQEEREAKFVEDAPEILAGLGIEL